MKIVAGYARLVLVLVALTWLMLARASDAATPDASGHHAPSAPQSLAAQPLVANFLGAIASKDARRVADWVVASDDNDGLPFVIVDKVRAKVFVFDDRGRLLGVSFALLGAALGDDSVPGIGSRKLSMIRPEERTTPAGRFVAGLGHDLRQDVFWIDYNSSVSLHRVITGNPGDHRLKRLETTSALDKRITYGCINVPVKFFEEVMLPTFTGTTGIVYILPEIKTI